MSIGFGLEKRRKEFFLKFFSKSFFNKTFVANIFLQHTSASLTIKENADPDVRKDMEYISNKIAPEVRPEIY